MKTTWLRYKDWWSERYRLANDNYFFDWWRWYHNLDHDMTRDDVGRPSQSRKCTSILYRQLIPCYIRSCILYPILNMQLPFPAHKITLQWRNLLRLYLPFCCANDLRSKSTVKQTLERPLHLKSSHFWNATNYMLNAILLMDDSLELRYVVQRSCP